MILELPVYETDEQLMARAAVFSDSEAFAEIFRRWWRRIRWYFLKRLENEHTAEELASEAFLRAFGARDQFRLDAEFSRWFYGIARNLLFTFCKSKANRQRRGLADFETSHCIHSAEPPVDAGLIAAETREIVETAVCGLPDIQFDLLRRHYWEETPLTEVAEEDHLSHQAVSLRLVACRDSLRFDRRLQRLFCGEVA